MPHRFNQHWSSHLPSSTEAHFPECWAILWHFSPVWNMSLTPNFWQKHFCPDKAAARSIARSPRRLLQSQVAVSWLKCVGVQCLQRSHILAPGQRLSPSSSRALAAPTCRWNERVESEQGWGSRWLAEVKTGTSRARKYSYCAKQLHYPGLNGTNEKLWSEVMCHLHFLNRCWFGSCKRWMMLLHCWYV